MKITSARNLVTTMAFTSLATACSSSDSGTSSAVDPPDHVYALQTQVYGLDDEVTSYVALGGSLDIEGELSLDDAREFPSYAFITAVDDKLLVSSGEEPIISQFEVTAAGQWHQTAELSFANLGVGSLGAGFERHWFLNEHVAYLTLEVTSRIVWDPTAFEIVGVKDDTRLDAERDGLTLDATFNRPPQLPKGPVLKPFYYRDADWFRFGPSTPVAVYDQATHEERAVLDLPCPALEVLSQDEQGNTYFSPWTYGPTLSLFGEGPVPCVRRTTSDSKLDETWNPDLTAWTDGRPVMVVRYLKDGKALGSVLHVDEVEGDFSAGYDEELAAELDDHYRLWWFDFDAETARPIDGIGSTGSGFNIARLDDRSYVFVPDAEWSRTTVYELNADGQATPRFEVAGLVNNWLKVR